MNIVIVANGQGFNNNAFIEKIKNADCLIAADGGINNCLQHEIVPDFIVGDMDSSEKTVHNTQKTEIIYLEEQDTTDMEKALAFAESLKPAVIDVFCSFGKRTDHSLGNIIILNNTKIQNLTMYDATGCFRALNPGIHLLNNRKGRTISLFCFKPVKEIELKGFKYPLKSKNIGPVFIGVSNIITENIASIKFREGRLLLYELDN